jgi:hypothetical protein
VRGGEELLDSYLMALTIVDSMRDIAHSALKVPKSELPPENLC